MSSPLLKPLLLVALVLVVPVALIAATYCALGHQANQYGWLPLAVCTSSALPLAIVWYLRCSKSQVVSD